MRRGAVRSGVASKEFSGALLGEPLGSMMATMESSRARGRIERCIRNLGHPDTGKALRAENSLLRHGVSRVLEPLVHACRDESPSVRYRAVWLLGHTRDRSAFETILCLTKDRDERVRYDAAIALGILGDRRAIGPLVRLATKPDPEYFVDDAACEGLYRLGKAAVPALIKLLQSRDTRVQYSAGHALGQLRAKSAVEPLSALLQSPIARTRLAGVDALGAYGSARCLALVKACISDPDETVRSEAEFWLSGGFETGRSSG